MAVAFVFCLGTVLVKKNTELFTMSHQGQFPLSNRDVISVVVCPQAPNQLYSGQTHRFHDLLSKLAATIGVQSSYLTEGEMLGLMQAGIPCELLQPGMDWQSGRLKLELSFEADAAETNAAEADVDDTEPAFVSQGAVESAPEVISEAVVVPSFAAAAPVAVAAAAVAVAMPAAAIETPEMPESDAFDLDEFTIGIDPMGGTTPAMDLDLDDAITAFADDDQLDLDAVEEVTFVRAPAAPALAELDLEDDQMVAAALGDMDGLDAELGLLDSELDNGFGDMPSFDDTSGFGDGDLDSAIAFGEPDLFALGEPEPLETVGQPVSLSALEDEFDFGDLDQPDHGTMVDVPRETAGASVESLDLGFDSGFNFDSESAAIEAGMNAVLGFEDDLEMPSLGDAPVADSLGDAFDFGDDLDLEAAAAEFSLDSDFDLEMDLGNLAMNAAKMDALDPASSATLSTEAKPAKPVDTASLDALGFDELDNPWDLSDDLDAMLLSNGPLS
jgi:hypothetical protein